MERKRGRPPGSHDITPQIRGAWKRACLIVEDRGSSLSELIADAIEKDVLAALKAIQGFLPKESQLDLRTSDFSLVRILSDLNTEEEQGKEVH